jgi:hypothetical protein
MSASQKNFSLFTYVDGTGQSWNMRGEEEEVRNAVDGSAAAGAHPHWGRSTRRHSPRKIVYVDLTTGRTKTCIFYTAAAAAAITLNTSTLSFPVEGEVAAVVYTASKLIAEKLPKGTAPTTQLADHA